MLFGVFFGCLNVGAGSSGGFRCELIYEPYNFYNKIY